MKKFLAVLFVVFLLTGCASSGDLAQLKSSLNQTNTVLAGNIKRIDQNFVVVKGALDAQAKAITELQPKKEVVDNPNAPVQVEEEPVVNPVSEA